MLIVAGFHVPVTPLVDVAGSAGAMLLWQRGGICRNTGVTWLVIVTDIVVDAPHCPGAGVKVYTDVPTMAVLIVAGLQVPVRPFDDVVGSEGGVLF